MYSPSALKMRWLGAGDGASSAAVWTLDRLFGFRVGGSLVWMLEMVLLLMSWVLFLGKDPLL